MSKNHVVGFAIVFVLLAALVLGNIQAVRARKPTPTPPPPTPTLAPIPAVSKAAKSGSAVSTVSNWTPGYVPPSGLGK